jgi:tetratricopeptide (TPR) repeat protein
LPPSLAGTFGIPFLVFTPPTRQSHRLFPATPPIKKIRSRNSRAFARVLKSVCPSRAATANEGLCAAVQPRVNVRGKAMYEFKGTTKLLRVTLRLLGFATGLVLSFAFAQAMDTVAKSGAPNLTSVRAKIKAKDYKAALDELNKIASSTQHPDVYSLMGFALRKSGDYKQARTYYNKALDFDPNHRGALEYQGELFVETGELEKAKQNLAKLEKLCPDGCEERKDLAEAIAQTLVGKAAH